MAPNELRREVGSLRSQLSEAKALQQEQDQSLQSLRSQLATQEEEAEARFEDMRDFMEGLLKKLKEERDGLRVENNALRAQTPSGLRAALHAQPLHGISEMDDTWQEEEEEEEEERDGETDEFLRLEAEARAAEEEEGGELAEASSPLREARARRVILLDGDAEEAE